MSPDRRGRLLDWLCVAAMAINCGLLAYSAWRHSPTFDEVAHLPAGLSHWQLARFELYRVNPPLVRMIAAMPVLAAKPKTDWSSYREFPGNRCEFNVGTDFIAANGVRSFFLFALARWACIPLSVLGAWVCWRWSSDLFGPASGRVAVVLWCFSPSVLAHGALITPDMGATALGATACYGFWRWLRQPSAAAATCAGLLLGFAELCKTLWVVLFLLWPLLWIVYREPHKQPAGRIAREFAALAWIMTVALVALNAAYGCEGSFVRLGDYQFVSRSLTGRSELSTHRFLDAGNRFSGTMLGEIPVPLPRNYVLGVDAQKRDFEERKWSYLRGWWRHGGWCYYYIYAMAIKEPLGWWLILGLAIFVSCFRDGYRALWRDELVLLAPALAVLALVSSQTGFNHHLRYVLPCYPFLIVWASKVGRSWPFGERPVQILVGAGLVWASFSSLAVFPHSLSYFNELIGGSANGHYHLGNSNVDWGQDLLDLKRWLDRNPRVEQLHVAFDGPYEPDLAGIRWIAPSASAAPNDTRPSDRIGPIPGWYAMSVNQIHRLEGDYRYFLAFEPVDRIGYSMNVYHITKEDANRVRRDLGLQELP